MNREKRNHRYYFKDDATYVADLEFAARIGKILLEQNKGLEDHSKLLQEKIADQDAKILVRFLDTLFIQYLSKLLLDVKILIFIFIKKMNYLKSKIGDFPSQKSKKLSSEYLKVENIAVD